MLKRSSFKALLAHLGRIEKALLNAISETLKYLPIAHIYN
jgi:hypothetical protein